MPGIRRGMWSISWFKEILGTPWENFANNEDTSIENILDKEAENVPPGCDGLITVPEFMAPVGMHYRKALMIGFDGRHKRAHIYRSLLEAIAMTIHMSMEDMFEEKGYTPERLIISGGGSNSDEFMRIFADVFGMPSYRNEVNNAAGIGAAIGAKVYPSYEVAVGKMVKIKNHFEPTEENIKIYQDIEKNIYRGIKEYSDPINKEIFKLFK